MEPIILSTNKEAIQSVINFLSIKICPILIDISSSFNALGIGKFSQEAYEDLVMNKTKNVSENFREHIESEIRNSKLSAPIRMMLDSEGYITEALAPLIKGTSELLSEMGSYDRGITVNGEVKFSDIEIINSLPLIKEDEIRRRYQLIVESPEQLSLLNKMQELIRIYDDLRNDTVKIGVYVIPSFEDYFEIQENGSLITNPLIFGFFEELSESGLKALQNSPGIYGRVGNKLSGRMP